MRNSLVAVIYAGALLLASCESKAGQGALIGGGTGAVAGGLIGGNVEGALIGGAVGAAAGGLIGYSLDQQDREIMEQRSPQTLNRIDNNEPLTIYDVEQMSQNGLNDEVIINQIKATHSTFYLNHRQIRKLEQSGVSQRVIDYMIETGK